MAQGRFLTGSTMGHVVRMTATGAMGITFVFLVDAANLLWISQLGDPQLVAAIGFAFAIQFFSVSSRRRADDRRDRDDLAQHRGGRRETGAPAGGCGDGDCRRDPGLVSRR